MDTIEMLDTMLDNLKTFRADSEFYKAEKQKLIENVKGSANYVLADTKQNESDIFAMGLEAEIKKAALAIADLCAELPERVKVKNVYSRHRVRQSCSA